MLKLPRLHKKQIASYAGGVFAGILSACLLIFAVEHAGSPVMLLAYLASVPVVMAGLGGGIIAGAFAVFAATLALFITQPASTGLYYLISYGFPMLGFITMAMSARILRDGSLIWCREGVLLTALIAYICAVFLAVFVLSMGHDGGLLAMTTDMLNGVSEQILKMLDGKGEKFTPDMTLQLQNYLTLAARIIPALLMCGWLFSTIGSIVVAQSVIVQKKWNVRPVFALENIHVPNWVVYAAAATGLVAQFAPAPYDYAALNVALMMGVPFFFAGLAVVHAWAGLTRAPVFALIGFYVIICLFVYLALMVALLGVVDQWGDFRKRFAERNETK